MAQHKIYDDQLIVITGAAGFIGSSVVRTLNDQGFSNLLLVDDIKRTEKWKNLTRKKFVDIISRDELFDWLVGREQQVEAFIHLGACADTVETDGNYVMANNYRFSIKLAEYALKHGHRFIYASSAATYGNGSKGFCDEHDLIDALEPMNLYGFSKHAFDLWLKGQGALGQVVGLKYFNVFGPNEWHKGRMASMIYHLTPKIQKERVARLFQSSQPDLYPNGGQCRDFIYVKDVAKITCSFLSNDLNGIFNVGRGEPETWNALTTAIFNALDIPPKIEYIPMPEDLIKQYQNYTCADLKKYHRELKQHGLEKPKLHTLEESVKDYVQNHLLTDTRW